MEIPENWSEFNDYLLEDSILSEKWSKLQTFIAAQDEETIVYPPIEMRFKALEMVNPENTKVFICGQDVYPREGQGMGLAFSVPSGITIPPSLKTIYKGIFNYCGSCPTNGDLTYLAKQNVLLLNSALTVKAGKANSHQANWSFFTDILIKWLSETQHKIVFILWGNHAKEKASLICKNNGHYIIGGTHPSPMAHRDHSKPHPFLNTNYFGLANEFLEANHNTTIQWAG